MPGTTSSGSRCSARLGETDVVRNGPDAWLWSSGSNSATHYTVPAGKAGKAEADRCRPAHPAAGRRAGAGRDRPDHDGEHHVTRRSPAADAYELVLAPKDTRSLVGQVRLAVDAETSVPLRVQVFGRDSADGPAFSVGFSR